MVKGKSTDHDGVNGQRQKYISWRSKWAWRRYESWRSKKGRGGDARHGGSTGHGECKGPSFDLCFDSMFNFLNLVRLLSKINYKIKRKEKASLTFSTLT